VYLGLIDYERRPDAVDHQPVTRIAPAIEGLTMELVAEST